SGKKVSKVTQRDVSDSAVIGGDVHGDVFVHTSPESPSKQKGLEVPLQSLEERNAALKETHLAMVNCFWELARNFGGTTEARFVQTVVARLEEFEITIARNQLWLSTAEPKILDARGKFRLTAIALRFR